LRIARGLANGSAATRDALLQHCGVEHHVLHVPRLRCDIG
jgi:hypothetical protein